MKSTLATAPSRQGQGRWPALPTWQVNLLIFGLLILTVLAGFFFELDRVNKSFQQHALGHSRLVSGVIEENVRNSFLVRATLDDVIHTVLRNSARFIEYLDSVQPFTPQELTAYAEEAGLAGVTIIRPPRPPASGPRDWLPLEASCAMAPVDEVAVAPGPLVYVVLPLHGPPLHRSCVILGLDGARIALLRKKTGLPALLESMSALPGVDYVRFEYGRHDEEGETLQLVATADHVVAETRLRLTRGTLVVGLDARTYDQRVRALRNHFLLFGGLLVLLGLLFSWLLYRYQAADLERTRAMERILGREHEAASLGRATATIAHEVRNPLNAIDMGLQRLMLESSNLDQEQEELVGAMRQAVRRAGTIVTELQRFTRPPRPRDEPVALDRLLSDSLALYGGDGAVAVDIETQGETTVHGDPDLLAELLDNLVKNAFEAQPGGGFLRAGLRGGEEEVELVLENGGFHLDPEESARMGEPYFTRKTRGTGLGLALAHKIAEAHGGTLGIAPDHEAHTLRIRVRLPRILQAHQEP